MTLAGGVVRIPNMNYLLGGVTVAAPHITSNDPELHCNLGVVCWKLRRVYEAIREWQIAVRMVTGRGVAGSDGLDMSFSHVASSR